MIVITRFLEVVIFKFPYHEVFFYQMDEKGIPKSIKLPETIEAFRNLKNAKRFAVDIGK